MGRLLREGRTRLILPARNEDCLANEVDAWRYTMLGSCSVEMLLGGQIPMGYYTLTEFLTLSLDPMLPQTDPKPVTIDPTLNPFPKP